jgi:hypothetical protein
MNESLLRVQGIAMSEVSFGNQNKQNTRSLFEFTVAEFPPSDQSSAKIVGLIFDNTQLAILRDLFLAMELPKTSDIPMSPKMQ